MYVYRLRPHHGLCILFFEGKGYSEEFVRNMTDVTAALSAPSARVRTVSGTDLLCAACPHNKNGICDSSVKVECFDRKVTEICGLHIGEELKADDFFELVKENIIRAGRLREVCGNCEWNCADNYSFGQ